MNLVSRPTDSVSPWPSVGLHVAFITDFAVT
ncbi:hypothetical protein SUDANB170_07586 (plasmid) [Streptomyces sp. enrichment culture]